MFNQLAGENATAVSPLAAGTKHPVCLAPLSAADEALLRSLFPGFVLQAWNAAGEALEAADEHYLFWRAVLCCRRSSCCSIRPTSIPTPT